MPLTKRSLAKLLLVVSSVCATGLIVEAGARVYTWHSEGVPLTARNPHPQLDLYMPHPYLISVPRPGGRWRQFSVNSLGYRGDEFEIEKPQGTYRIAVLGGSTTWGYIVDNEDTYPKRLEEILNHACQGRIRFEVINAGVPGFTSAESLINLNLRILDTSPDLVFIYHAYNDLKPNRHPGFLRDYSHFRRYRGRIPVPFYQRHLRLGYLTFSIHRLNQVRYLLPQKRTHYKRFDSVASEGISAFRKNLMQMVKLSRSQDVEVMLSTYATSLTPENLRDYPDRFKPLWGNIPTLTYDGILSGFRSYNEATRSVADQESTQIVQQDRLIPKNFDYFYDHVHLTQKGTRLFAKNLSEKILTTILPKCKRSDRFE